MGRKTEPPKPGHIVAEYAIKNTRVTVCDDFVVPAGRENDEILYRAGDIHRRALERKIKEDFHSDHACP